MGSESRGVGDRPSIPSNKLADRTPATAPVHASHGSPTTPPQQQQDSSQQVDGKWKLASGAASRPEPDAATRLMGKLSPVDKPNLVPASMINLLWGTNNDMGMHHLGWHLMARPDRDRWISQLKQDPDFVKFNARTKWLDGMQKLKPLNEGSKGNGVAFGAMHRGMIEVLKNPKTYEARGLPVPEGLDKIFEGWKEIPTEVIAKVTPPEQQPKVRKTLEMLMNIETNWKQFNSLDELCNFMQTQVLSQLGVSGTHNILHVAMADGHSPIDVGDPMLNLYNKNFWGLHGFIDNVISGYIKARGKGAKGADATACKKELAEFNKVKKAQTEHMVHSLSPLPAKVGTKGPVAHGPVVPPPEIPLSLREVSKQMFQPPE